jgi:hypothetical protein
MLQVKSRRRPNPLYGARIHGKPLRYLAHALSAPGRLQSGQDSSFSSGAMRGRPSCLPSPLARLPRPELLTKKIVSG